MNQGHCIFSLGAAPNLELGQRVGRAEVPWQQEHASVDEPWLRFGEFGAIRFDDADDMASHTQI